jgi:hypothetical protein
MSEITAFILGKLDQDDMYVTETAQRQLRETEILRRAIRAGGVPEPMLRALASRWEKSDGYQPEWEPIL